MGRQDGEYPYFDQAKHIVGATLLFALIAAIAIGIDRCTVWLVKATWLSSGGVIYWVLKCAEYFLFLLDIAALLIITARTTYTYVMGFFR